MTTDMEGAVAVVGMACRLPCAGSLTGYWELLRKGREGITHSRRDDLIAAGVDPALVRREDYVRSRGLLAGACEFDWSFFGYSQAEAALIDPQQRQFLECAVQALDDAGVDPSRFPGWIGVFGGADGTGDTGQSSALSPLAQAIGQRQDFLTTRVAYKLGLRGPAITVQTACSTSLAAVHMAVLSLLAHECDMALAGGVSVSPSGHRGYLYSEGGILSPDGHCRPFDEQAAGTVPSDGVGIVVLKRLADAVRDADRIAAVIRGSAVNNDGQDKIGYTAPSVAGQRDAILLAQKVAAVDPTDIHYVEAHGTGTRIGDPVEVQALTDGFRLASDASGWCWLGAVKSNIGHTGAAAGVAGLIKTVLMIEHRELVPTLHYRRPNPLLDVETTPFKVCAQHRPWPERGMPLAAVSSFGVGGTNVHVVVESAPARIRPKPRTAPRLLPLSAATAPALDRASAALSAHLVASRNELGEAARTLTERRVYKRRRVVVAAEPDEAARLFMEEARPASGVSLDRVAFLFPGQGTLGHAAGTAAYRSLPGFRAAFDRLADAARNGSGVDLGPVVGTVGAADGWFGDTVHQQLGLLALGYALGQQLVEWGIVPSAMLGNSVGEYPAALIGGVWSPEDAAQLVFERACAMRDTGPGGMVVVTAEAQELARRLGSDKDVSIAVAGPGRTVISGGVEALGRLLAGDALRGLETRVLDTRHAFHSPAMEPAMGRLRDAAACVTTGPVALPLISNVSGQWARQEEIRQPGYWADQLRQPVLLEQGMTTLLGSHCEVFLELGPGTSMTGALRRHQAWHPQKVALPLLSRPDDDAQRSLLRAVGTLWELGADLPLGELLDGERPFVCSLPPYSFDSRDPQEAVSDERPRLSAIVKHGGRSDLERLWCSALGVAMAAADDDFFSLGGESLTAVDLISRVRERTGAEISVSDFTRTPTFGRLVELVDRTGPGTPGLVRLRSSGAGIPLFFAADALGTVAPYQALADLLSHPVYGLEPVGPSPRGMRIEQIAASHVAAIRSAFPAGPYAIGGWSFGAVVAHEVARRLIAADERVELLVCLDGHVPGWAGRPIWRDLTFLRNSLLLQAGAATGTGPVGARIRGSSRLRRRFIANINALLRYRSAPATCAAVVFAAGANEAAASRLQRTLAGLYSEVRVETAEGDHWSMLTAPHARDLAHRIEEVLP